MQILKLSWRSIWRNRRRTLITVVAVGFSLAIAVFFLAMADGMYAHLLDSVLRMQAGHLTVEHRQHLDAPSIDLVVRDLPRWRPQVAALPAVEQTAARVVGQGVASTGTGSVGVSVVGVEPDVERRRWASVRCGPSPASQRVRRAFAGSSE